MVGPGTKEGPGTSQSVSLSDCCPRLPSHYPPLSPVTLPDSTKSKKKRVPPHVTQGTHPFRSPFRCHSVPIPSCHHVTMSRCPPGNRNVRVIPRAPRVTQEQGTGTCCGNISPSSLPPGNQSFMNQAGMYCVL